MLDAWRDIHNLVDLDLYTFSDPSNIGSFELTAYPFPLIYFKQLTLEKKPLVFLIICLRSVRELCISRTSGPIWHNTCLSGGYSL